MALQDRPDARRGDRDAHGGELAVDPPVAPGRVLLRQPEDERRGSCGDGRSTRPAMWVGPALGDEVTVPAQQGCRLDEEASLAPAREQSPQSGQHRPVGRLQRRTVDLASEDRHLVAQHDDLDGEIACPCGRMSRISWRTRHERPVQEREGHRWMLARAGAFRQSPAQRLRMAFSAPTRPARPSLPARPPGAPGALTSRTPRSSLITVGALLGARCELVSSPAVWWIGSYRMVCDRRE